MELTQEEKQYLLNWLKEYTNEFCIERRAPWEEMPTKNGIGTSSWQFYLRRGLFDVTYLNYVGYLFWDHYKEIYEQTPFQITGLETGSTPLVVGLMMTAPAFGIRVDAFSIRAQRKTYGLLNRFEGLVKELPVLIVDDISNSQSTIKQAREYCLEEGLTLMDEVFTLVHKHSAGKQEIDTTIKSYDSEGITFKSLMTLDDFDLSIYDYTRKKAIEQQNAVDFNE